MGVRIKVTGYLDPEDDERDPTDDTGLTEEAFLQYNSAFASQGLDDINFEPEPTEDDE